MEYEAAASKAPSRLAWWFRNLTIALGVWFVIAVVALVYVTINGRVPQFAGVKFNLAIFVAWTVVFVAAAALTRTWTPAGASVRILAILFFGLLFATSIVGGYFAKHEYASVLQWIFVFVVVLFPGTLYFLFISSRRQAMFTAFWVAIGRLGLLNRRQIRAGDGSLREESEEEYALRKQLYFERFAANAGGLDGAKVKEPDSASSPPQFETAVTLREAIPVFVYTALIAIGWISLMQCALILPGNWANVLTLEQLPFMPIRKTAPNFAFLGAYFFCLQLLVRRFMSHDLAPGAYVSASFRTVLAVVLTWAVTELLEGEGLNQAFATVKNHYMPSGCDIGR
ncbi:MAG: hypothetical protein FJX47_18425, partial [Alphaproteobacteria bacterium]|nr:hypothetical protein [Alphaproteobacteria bacterium]